MHERVARTSYTNELLEKKLHEAVWSYMKQRILKYILHQLNFLTRTYWRRSTFKMSSSRNISRVWLQEEVIISRWLYTTRVVYTTDYHGDYILLELYHGFPILWHVPPSDHKKHNIRKIHVRKIQERLSTSIPSITIEDIEEKLHK